MAKNFQKSKYPTSPSKSARRSARADKRRGGTHDNVIDIVPNIRGPVRNGGINTKPMEYLTPKQQTYHQMIQAHTLTFGLGPAGTGKTHVAVDHAALALLNKEISQIIISRPAVESGRGMGFLPGEIEDKWAPYFRPVRKILEKRLGVGAVEAYIKNGTIEIAPLEYLRGNTFENAFVLLDEGQNTTVKEMQTFLTRIGRYCTVVVDGDVEQVDIKEPSGLVDAIERLRGMQSFCVCEFDETEIVRDPLVKEIILRYRRK